MAHYQFAIGVIYLAIFPNVLSEAALNVTDIAVLTAIFMIKLIAPMMRSSAAS